jgi:hypothetical protein
MPSFNLRVSVLFSVIALTGCSTVWSPSQTAKLAHIATTPATVAPNAYEKPSAKDSPHMSRSIPQATGGGLIPSLLGSAIDGAVTAHQQSKFEKTAAEHFEALKTEFGDAPSAEVNAALIETLQADPFFGPRLAKEAPAKFTVTINSYGLAKSPLSEGDDILLRVQIGAEVKLEAADESLFSFTVVGVGSRAARATEILKQADFINASKREAAIDLANQVLGQLQPKIGGKAPARALRR